MSSILAGSMAGSNEDQEDELEPFKSDDEYESVDESNDDVEDEDEYDFEDSNEEDEDDHFNEYDGDGSYDEDYGGGGLIDFFDFLHGQFGGMDEDEDLYSNDSSRNSSPDDFSSDHSSDDSSLAIPDGIAKSFKSFALPPFPPPLSNRPSLPDYIDSTLDGLIKRQCSISSKRFLSFLFCYETRAYDLILCSIWNEKEKIALALIDAFADSNSRILGRDPKHCPDDSPLHIAVELGNVNIIKKFLEKNANVNLKNPLHSVTPIKSALLRNRHDLVAIFVDHLARMPPADLPMDADIKPLHWACMGTNLEHIRYFLDFDPSAVNLPIDQTCAEELSGYTPLHLAVEFGTKKTVEFLLDRGADLEARARQSKTPLHVATDFLKYFRRKLSPDRLRDQAGIVSFLLQRGSNVNARNESGATPLFSLLTSSLAFLKSDKVNYYLHQDNRAGLEDFLDRLQKIYSPLLIANMLLKRGAQTEGIMHELTHAPYWGDYEKRLVKFLQFQGCDVNFKLRRKTPLMALVTSHRFVDNEDEAKTREDMMRFLLSCGAKTEITYTDRLLTPLHWALRHRHPRVVELLLRYGANPNALTRKKRTPLHLAIAHMSSKDFDMLRSLINYCPNINLVDNKAKTAMDYLMEVSMLNPQYHFKPPSLVLPELMIKYDEIGYHVSKENSIALKDFFRQYDEPKKLRKKCQDEIERLKRHKIDDNSTFYSILHKTPNQLALKSNSAKFKKIAESFDFDENGKFQPAKYKNYGPIIKFLYQRGAKRFDRMQKAEEAMIQLTLLAVPSLCFEEISSRLSDGELRNLKMSTKYLEKKDN